MKEQNDETAFGGDVIIMTEKDEGETLGVSLRRDGTCCKVKGRHKDIGCRTFVPIITDQE